jgi:hypothetical protein
MDELEHEAIQTDVYLDRLLASRWDPPAPIAVSIAEDPVEAELRDTAELLGRTLIRFHPSFRFEEALGARLRSEGGAPRPTGGRVIAFPGGAAATLDQAEATLPVDRRGRGLLVGGAIASGVSIASIAGVVLWRRTRTTPGIHLAERLS